MSAFNGIANTNTVNYVPVQATFDSSGNFITFIGPGGKAFTTASGLAINTTSITGGTSGRVLYDNAGIVGELGVIGTGNVVLSDSPSVSNLSGIGSFSYILTGSNSFNIDGDTGYSGDIIIGGINNDLGAITIGQAVNSSTMNLGIGQHLAGQTFTLNVANGSLGGATNINVGTANGTCSTVINGNLTVDATTSKTITIGGTSATGAITLGRSTGAQTVNIATGFNTATKTLNLGTGSSSGATNIAIGATGGTSTTTVNGYFKPQQATTAGAPAYVKGAIYFDTTLNKLRVGGATAWETITSV